MDRYQVNVAWQQRKQGFVDGGAVEIDGAAVEAARVPDKRTDMGIWVGLL
jgi:hypothetical protein